MSIKFSRCSLIRSGMILANISGTLESTQMPLQLLHSIRVPFFITLTIIYFLNSLEKIAYSQHLRMSKSCNSTESAKADPQKFRKETVKAGSLNPLEYVDSGNNFYLEKQVMFECYRSFTIHLTEYYAV